MLLRTKKGGSPDVARLGRALSRPGMDPRVWASQAIVRAVNVTSAGVYLDVFLIPDKLDETARWGSMYSGPGYGFYFPVAVDDTVLVINPSGEPDHGLLAIPWSWEPADPPPVDAVSNPNDAVLLMQTDRNVRLVTQGSGDLVLDPRGTGKVRLGGETGTRKVVLDGDPGGISGIDLVNLQTNLDARYAIGGGLPLTDVALTVASTATKVEGK